MAMAMNTLKNTARFGINTTIVVAKAAKYGLHFAFGISKTFLGGAKSLANQFAKGAEFPSIGENFLDETYKVTEKGIDLGISALANLKRKIR